IPPPPGSTLFPYTTLFRSLVGQIRTELLGDQTDLAVGPVDLRVHAGAGLEREDCGGFVDDPDAGERHVEVAHQGLCAELQRLARSESTRLNSSHVATSYAV